MRQLLQSISTDPQLKQSKDSILLAEDQYPESLDAIFTRLTTPTTLQNTLNLLKWSRKFGGTAMMPNKRHLRLRVKITYAPPISLHRLLTVRGIRSIPSGSGSTLSRTYACPRFKKLSSQGTMLNACSTSSPQIDPIKPRAPFIIPGITSKGCCCTTPYY